MEDLNENLSDTTKGGILGAVIGFLVFIAGTISIGGVYTRPSVENIPKFKFDGLIEFIKAPFMIGTETFKTVWALYPDLDIFDRLGMLQLNWVAIVGVGVGIGATLTYAINQWF
jgi:hypothetical protein